VVLFIDSVDD
jgi:hypothetical protein